MKIKHLTTLLLLSVIPYGFSYGSAIKLKRNNIFTATDSLFKPANIFQSNMVIQQQKDFAIWGNATAGNTVTIKADWTDKAVTVTADGSNYWKGQIPVPKAIPGNFTPHT
ncbi:MAG TPA: hypothetical protein VGC01_01515, partial [Mucilaginibacter sp.]